MRGDPGANTVSFEAAETAWLEPKGCIFHDHSDELKRRRQERKHPSGHPLLMRGSNLKLFLTLIQKPFSMIKLFSSVLTLVLHKLSPTASLFSKSRSGGTMEKILQFLNDFLNLSNILLCWTYFKYWRKAGLPFHIHLKQNEITYFKDKT